MADQCPATTRYTPSLTLEMRGLQCKFTSGHHGDHCAYTGPGQGDVFWPQENATMADDAVSDEDRIRDAMAEARDHPGRTITR